MANHYQLGITAGEMFFDDWMSIVRTLIVGLLAYIALVILLRISGKRTLSKMNAFDLVVTVALGSTLASILLDQGISLAQGIVALALLIGLQFAATWLSIRNKFISTSIKSQPRLLMHNGELLMDAMIQERVLADEIEAAARTAGLSSLDQVKTVVLETDGSMSVIARDT